MSVNHSVKYSVKRAFAAGTIALFGSGAAAAHALAIHLTSVQPNAVPVTAVKTATTKKAKKATEAQAPILVAQTTPAPAAGSTLAAPPQLETVVVTGTLIARPSIESAEPITIMKAAAIKNLGLVNVEQAVDTITANVPGVNIARSTGTYTGGGSFANLRDLGAGRTLVLLDGERLADNAFDGTGVDLSGIPFSALESVQVLREGASSLYGSDAIGGVINFITRHDYQGAEIAANVNHPQEPGGASGDADFTYGHGSLAGDGYNFMITGSYSEQKELIATQRSFSATGFDPARGLANTNNPGTWPATIVDANGNAWQPGYPACAGNPFPVRYYGNCGYLYSAATDLLPKATEASGLATFTKALPAGNTLALQYFYTRSEVTDWGGPEFYQFGMTPAADPTYFPTAAGLTCSGNTVTGGPCTAPVDLADPLTAIWTDPGNNRFNKSINTEQRALLTFSGENEGWNYKVVLNYGQNQASESDTGGYPNEAVLAPNGIISNLVNPFGPQSAAGQSFINSTYVNGVFANGKIKHWSVSGNAGHDLGDAFGAGHPAALAIGGTISGDNFDFATTPLDPILFAANSFAPIVIHGTRQAQAVFVELDVPMSKHLDVDISDREDRYSDFGRTNNGKVSVRYQPFRYLTFRGAASTGFRAPTLFNLYEPNNIASTAGTVGQNNPICQSGNYTTEFSALVCNSQGTELAGGNAHLKPETSQNFDVGIIAAPIRDLGITLDYYRIIVKSPIGNIPTEAVFANPAEFASDYVLNSAGTLTPSIAQGADCTPYTAPTCGYILQTFQNTGGITTDGADVSVQYLQHASFGELRWDLEGTVITQFRRQLYTGGPHLNLVGWYNQGNLPAMRWQHMLRADWTSPQGAWGAGLSNRFFSSYIDENGVPYGGNTPRTVGSQSTWDTYISYKPIRPLTVLFGIHDLLNTNPPFSNNTNSFEGGYNLVFSSPLLRTFYVNLKYQLGDF